MWYNILYHGAPHLGTLGNIYIHFFDRVVLKLCWYYKIEV